MLKQVCGIWLPENEQVLSPMLPNEPVFGGAATFQLRKLQAGVKYIRNFRHAVDLGAHIGIWSRVLARMFGKLTAFEPLELNRQCFAKNLESVQSLCDITLHPYALGDTTGMVKMQVNPDKTAYAHVAKSGNTEVEVRRLDEFNLQNVDFIKIDVEGFEYFVVRGAEETIRRDKPFIILEQKPNNAERHGRGRIDALNILLGWGAVEMFNIGNDYGVRWK